MRKTKKARPSAATPGQATETRAPGQATRISLFEDNTFEERAQYRIEGLLHYGAENAMSTADLMMLTGYNSVRELRKQIENERSRGALILSSTTGGYFKPDKGEKGRHELAEYVRTMRARALNTLRAAQGARVALKSVEGQIAFSGAEVEHEQEKANLSKETV